MTEGSVLPAEPRRIRGFEMPWNRVLRAAADTAAGAARALNPWYPQEFLAECVETEHEAGDMMTFVFRRIDGAPLAFRPGQYLNIAFPVNGREGEPVDRSYSLSSSPTQPWTFSITVKRDPLGLVSQWAHDNVKPGTVLDMLGPVGAFHLPDSDRRARYLFLAAGAGITPLMSMVRTIHSLPGKADIVMLYHAARPGGFAFSRELEYLTSVDSRLRLHFSLGDRDLPDVWQYLSGRLSAETIERIAPDVTGRQIYACGPEGYLEAAAELLRGMGVDDTQINVEFFSGDRQTVLEYEDEVAMAEDIAGEVVSAREDYYAHQSASLDLYSANEPAAAGPPSSGFEAAPVGPPSSGFEEAPAGPPSSGFENPAGGPPVSGFESAPAGPPTSGFESAPSGPPSSGFESAPSGPPSSGFDGAPAGPPSAGFGAAPASPAAPAESAPPAGSSAHDTGSFKTVGEGEHRVSFVRTRLNVMVGSDEPILTAARRAGVRISMNCQEGMCGSCKSVKLEGEVDMNHQGGIRAREIEAGKFLPCCSTPLTDVVVDA